MTSESEIPKWLNTEFIEKHLRKFYGNNELKVHGLLVKPATAAGENFASFIYRVKVDFSLSSIDEVLFSKFFFYYLVNNQLNKCLLYLFRQSHGA